MVGGLEGEGVLREEMGISVVEEVAFWMRAERRGVEGEESIVDVIMAWNCNAMQILLEGSADSSLLWTECVLLKIEELSMSRGKKLLMGNQCDDVWQIWQN